MSTYLELAQDFHEETVDSGTISTVVSQTGQAGRAARWIKDAWTELQLDRQDWKWMRKSFTVNTVASTAAYAYGDCTDTETSSPIARFSRWYRNSFKCYLQSDGVATEYPLMWMSWDRFRRIYQYGAQTDGMPVSVSQSPNGDFVIGPAPDDVYVVSADYHLGAQILAADADEPEMPDQYHKLIVYEAMAKYGGRNIAPEAMIRANAEGGRLRFNLEQNQLPALTYGRALA